MFKDVFIIRKEEDIDPCVAWIKDHLALGAIEVVFSTETKNRSVMQNRLYWLWCTEIGNHLGYLKDEVHLMLKRKLAVPIFTRDDAGYARMAMAAQVIRKEDEDKYENLAEGISNLTSTTAFNVDQMSEYLNDVEHFAAEEGVGLTFPEDLMGYK